MTQVGIFTRCTVVFFCPVATSLWLVLDDDIFAKTGYVALLTAVTIDMVWEWCAKAPALNPAAATRSAVRPPGGTVTDTQRALIAALEAIRPEPAPEPTTAAALSAALSRAAADEIGHPDQATTENGSTS